MKARDAMGGELQVRMRDLTHWHVRDGGNYQEDKKRAEEIRAAVGDYNVPPSQPDVTSSDDDGDADGSGSDHGLREYGADVQDDVVVPVAQSGGSDDGGDAATAAGSGAGASAGAGVRVGGDDDGSSGTHEPPPTPSPPPPPADEAGPPPPMPVTSDERGSAHANGRANEDDGDVMYPSPLRRDNSNSIRGTADAAAGGADGSNHGDGASECGSDGEGDGEGGGEAGGNGSGRGGGDATTAKGRRQSLGTLAYSTRNVDVRDEAIRNTEWRARHMFLFAPGSPAQRFAARVTSTKTPLWSVEVFHTK